MDCPICSKDLSPLDVQSRAEHVEVCLENGPAVLETNGYGEIVIKKDIAEQKKRKICPICDKTFQNITYHFKSCALKHDVPLDLMLDYWDKINKEIKEPKAFPCDLLENFVAKCVKEGRMGEQVDFAKALYSSLADKDMPDISPIPSTDQSNTEKTLPTVNARLDNSRTTSVGTIRPSVSEVLMRNANLLKSGTKKYKIELTDNITKLSNIKLRIERELAASRSFQYSLIDNTQLNRLRTSNDFEACLSATSMSLFHRAALKSCASSEHCSELKCENHDFEFMIESFRRYFEIIVLQPKSTRPDEINADVATRDEDAPKPGGSGDKRLRLS